jgi:hypothetical protein
LPGRQALLRSGRGLAMNIELIGLLVIFALIAIIVIKSQ